MIPLFRNSSTKDKVESFFLLWEVFDIDFVAIGCVEEDASVLANQFSKELLENERSIGR